MQDTIYIDARFAYLIVAAIGLARGWFQLVAAYRPVLPRLDRIGVIGFLVVSATLPFALFWTLDRFQIVHDTSLVAALAVAITYQALLASGQIDTTGQKPTGLPQQLLSIFRPVSDWLSKSADDQKRDASARVQALRTCVIRQISKGADESRSAVLRGVRELGFFKSAAPKSGAELLAALKQRVLETIGADAKAKLDASLSAYEAPEAISELGKLGLDPAETQATLLFDAWASSAPEDMEDALEKLGFVTPSSEWPSLSRMMQLVVPMLLLFLLIVAIGPRWATCAVDLSCAKGKVVEYFGRAHEDEYHAGRLGRVWLTEEELAQQSVYFSERLQDSSAANAPDMLKLHELLIGRLLEKSLPDSRANSVMGVLLDHVYDQPARMCILAKYLPSALAAPSPGVRVEVQKELERLAAKYADVAKVSAPKLAGTKQLADAALEPGETEGLAYAWRIYANENCNKKAP